MHRYFSEWHRAVGGGLADVDLDARWSVVESIAGELDAEEAANLVRLALQLPVATGFVESLSERFQQAEPTFPMRGNARLLAVLSGAGVIQALGRDDGVATFAAYAVAAGGRLDCEPLVEDLASDCAEYLVRQAEHVRSRPPLPPAPKPAAWTKPVIDAIEAAAHPSNPELVGLEGFSKAIKSMGQSIQKAMETMAAQVAANVEWSQKVIVPLEEESAILTWLVSGGGEGLAHLPDDAPRHLVGLAAGWELAGLSKVLPAEDASQLLAQALSYSRAGTASEPAPLAACLAAVPSDLARPALVEELLDLTPVLALCAQRACTDSAKTRLVTPLELAEAAFIEALLARAWVDAL